MQSLVSRTKEQVKKVAIKALDEQLNNNEGLLDTKSKELIDKLPDIPVISPYLKPKMNKAVDKVTDTLVEKAKKVNKQGTDTDILIVGAGLSGIAMAMKLKKSRVLDRFMILERRQDVGGTWDLFQYPGIRSDSDISTFCFADYPWHGNQTLASGSSIKSYIKQTATSTGVTKYIRYGKSVERLDWSSEDKVWKVRVQDVTTQACEEITAKFVVGATGYYDFKQGYQPKFKDQEVFSGDIIHPQAWQKEYQYHDKKIVIIGSGATAVTLLPALLNQKQTKTEATQVAAHVTMLQRSPTYIAKVPSEDKTVEYLSQKWDVLPEDKAYELNRWKNILMQQGTYHFAKKAPKVMKTLLKYGTKKEIKGSNVSLDHFIPSYNPWDERLCAVPDGDLFQALQTGKADVVTDHIDRFTETGILLQSGRLIEADIIITATGLNLQMMGGASMYVDDVQVSLGDKMSYKATMIEDIPNLAVLFGYTNASWTLKVDVAAIYITRLLNHMSKYGYKTVVPVSTSTDGQQAQRLSDTVMGALSSGYVKRAADILPKQGDCYPWYVTNNYLTDRVMLLHRKINDEWLQFNKV